MRHSRFRIVTPTKLWSWLAVGIFVGLALGQASEPKFRELTREDEDKERLGRQRAVILAVLKQRYGTVALTRSSKDLPLLERLLDEKAFSESRTYELQSLGVVFGEAQMQESPSPKTSRQGGSQAGTLVRVTGDDTNVCSSRTSPARKTPLLGQIRKPNSSRT